MKNFRTCIALMGAASALLAYILQPYRGLSERVSGYLQIPQAWAVVLGGSDGLGEAWARQLASLGLNLILVARREIPLKALAAALREHDVQVETISADLRTLSADWLRSQVLADRDVRVLVYNAAATGPKGFFLQGDLDESLSAIEVNVRGVAIASYEFGKRLTERGSEGGIVLMSSMAGEVGTAWVANYAATKSYITKLAHGLSNELGPSKIDVLSCVAGATRTPTYIQTMSGVPTRKESIEQEPGEVVSECLSALGRTASVAPGSLNKFARLLLARLLPTDLAVRVLSQQTGEQMGFSQAA